METKKEQQKKRAIKQEQITVRQNLLAILRGDNGIQKWNKLSMEAFVEAGSFSRTDLSGADLQGVRIVSGKFRHSNFSKSCLVEATFVCTDISRSDFSFARMEHITAESCNADKAKFAEATLSDAEIDLVSFRSAEFTGTIFSGAKLSRCDFRGANLKAAILDSAIFEASLFDEHTTFPPDFVPVNWLWRGDGPNPVKKKPQRALRFHGMTPLHLKKRNEPLDMPTFIKLMGASDVVKKALTMLKKDQFHLYTEMGDDHLSGLVKSQSNPDLIYSCRIESDGSYACCTQNLRRCGGLNYSICKHLCVLIIGTATADKVDLDEMNKWVRMSRSRKPKLDKDQMTTLFLKWKGMQAGEIDWRPIETTPEDYFSY